MSNDAESVPVAAPALIGAGVLIGFTLLAVAVGRSGGVGITEKPEANPVASLALTVEDRSDGAITLHEAGSDRLVATVAPGQDGFLRATLRGFGQARLRAGHGRAEPFRLTRFDDGSLTLSDEATGRRVNLEAFGPTNAGAFARLLPETPLTEGSTIR
ncbi:photosynthetic complex assembly protein PuhC [Methylobacterium durans]|uniref:photosynthetic complex assembly protein PuhC n=1 Tax=Methylobacterium durans TaxID=2202825 RepID=UPI002AFE65D0|nr:photosynthetic complex assembly protein PuhC [Methylobacterium durans]MEA1830683.1 photosynthetic complex assembly protein PuhC [Methylobacterium durans]